MAPDSFDFNSPLDRTRVSTLIKKLMIHSLPSLRLAYIIHLSMENVEDDEGQEL